MDKAQREKYTWFTYIPPTHRIMLFEDDETHFSYWCLNTNTLIKHFDLDTYEIDVDTYLSVSGNWMINMIMHDAGNSQSVTVNVSYIGEGFDETRHINVLTLGGSIGCSFDIGFDEHDNLWVDGLPTNELGQSPEFSMEYYKLNVSNGDVECDLVTPCPYGRMDTDGFEQYNLEQLPISLTELKKRFAFLKQ